MQIGALESGSGTAIQKQSPLFDLGTGISVTDQ